MLPIASGCPDFADGLAAMPASPRLGECTRVMLPAELTSVNSLSHWRNCKTSPSYCSWDFTERYENWLMMALDHVIPASVCKAAGIQTERVDDHANRILCCSACNGFKNRWKPDIPPICPATLEAFFDLRGAIFVERKSHILKSQAEERKFFEHKPWAEPPTVS